MLLVKPLLPFLLSAWRAGLRSRGIQAILVLGVLLVGVAWLSGFFSPRQPKTVALDVGLSGIRFSLTLFALLWVQELIGQEVQRRTVFFALTYPVPRGHYIAGRYLGVVGLLALAALLLGMLLWVVILASGGNYEQGFSIAAGEPYWLTILGLWMDAAVVAAFATWIASFSTVGALPLALGLAFAVGGKSLGAVIEYLANGADDDPKIMQLAPIIDAIQWFLPDLSRLDWRAWPMYGMEPNSVALFGAGFMALSYVALMIAMAVLAFSRREFQ